MDEPEINVRLKVSLVGGFGVGKTAFFHRVTQDKFEPNTRCTLGVDFKSIILGNIRVDIFDTMGTEKYRVMTRSYYRNADVICICLDASQQIQSSQTKIKSSESARNGVPETQHNNPQQIKQSKNFSQGSLLGEARFWFDVVDQQAEPFTEIWFVICKSDLANNNSNYLQKTMEEISGLMTFGSNTKLTDQKSVPGKSQANMTQKNLGSDKVHNKNKWKISFLVTSAKQGTGIKQFKQKLVDETARSKATRLQGGTVGGGDGGLDVLLPLVEEGQKKGWCY